MEEIYWLHVPDKKRKKKYPNSNENMLFLRETDKIIWNPPLSKIPPPLLSNPSLSKFQK